MVNKEQTNAIIVFGGGCFWCIEAVFKMLKGVSSVVPGYAGGHKQNPSYKEVSTGTSGHAEVVKITYNPQIISLDDLLSVFFSVHDPTLINRQGSDMGEQYRSIILYTTQKQQVYLAAFIKRLSMDTGLHIATKVQPLEVFYPAEDYHYDYYATHRQEPYCQRVISPKIQKFKDKFQSLLKDNDYDK